MPGFSCFWWWWSLAPESCACSPFEYRSGGLPARALCQTTLSGACAVCTGRRCLSRRYTGPSVPLR
jgi:hypothetical protein